MGIPGFDAEKSLYRSGAGCRNAWRDAGEIGDLVVPAVGGPGAGSFQSCISDCLDVHPGWTRERCRRACTDPFGGTDLGGPDDPVNTAFSEAGCWSFYFICGSRVGCAEIRDKCLSDIRR